MVVVVDILNEQTEIVDNNGHMMMTQRTGRHRCVVTRIINVWQYTMLTRALALL